MFGRREKRTIPQTIRAQLWPRRGFRRVGRYVVARLQRLKTSPHGVAAGFASGVAVSFTPLIGLHFLLAFVVAAATRGSFIAAALGTAVGNPATFPLIFALTYWSGDRLGRLAGADSSQEAMGVVAGTFEGGPDADSEAAAGALMAAAGQLADFEWNLAGLAQLWPVFKTMLVGSVPLILLAYVAAYVVVRLALRALARRRAARMERAAGEA